jgi:outer membrane protein assembly factor BamB
VLAVAANTGEPLWFAPFGFTSVTAPAVDADAVYVAGWGVRNVYDRTQNDASGAVFALDQRTGRERWRFLAPVRFGPVSVGQESIYVPSDHGLYAIDRATGRKRWQARFTPDPGETATIAGKAIVIAGEEITTGKSGIFGLNADTGALLWRIDMPAATGASAGTAAVNDSIFVSWWEASPGHPAEGTPTLHAYDRETGKERWVFRATGDQPSDTVVGTGSVTAPVVVGDEVLFGVTVRSPSANGGESAEGLYAVDAATGDRRWHTAASTSIRSAPAVLDGAIFVMGGRRARGDASGGRLYAFAAGSS